LPAKKEAGKEHQQKDWPLVRQYEGSHFAAKTAIPSRMERHLSAGECVFPQSTSAGVSIYFPGTVFPAKSAVILEEETLKLTILRDSPTFLNPDSILAMGSPFASSATRQNTLGSNTTVLKV
jgi:hypothetical protein